VHQDCIDAVSGFLGRQLRAAESKAIEDSVKLQMRLAAREDPQSWSGMSPQERLEAGAQRAAAQIIEDVKLKQKRIALQIAAHDRIDSALADRFDQIDQAGGKPGDKLHAVSSLVVPDPAARMPFQSVESSANAIAGEAIGRLLPLWDSVKSFAHLFESKKGVSDLVHELFGEDTGNAAAKAGAKAWGQVTDELRERYNASGGDVGKLEDWHYPQSWSQMRIATAGKDASAALEKFTGDMLPLLDRTKYLRTDGTPMSEDNLREMLSHVFDTVSTDGANKRADQFKRENAAGAPTAAYSTGALGTMLADRQNAHRALFFKDADSYLTAQGLYGEKSLWPSLMGHVRSMARDIALTETLGPNAAKTFQFFNDRTKLDELHQSPAAANQINKAAQLNEGFYNAASSSNPSVVNQKVADWWQAARNLMTATKLGSVVLTAFGDEAGMASTAFANKIPYSDVAMRELHYLNPANLSDRDVASGSALGINRVIGGLNRMGQEDMQLFGGNGVSAAVRNFTSKLATGVLNASGAEGMWDTRRKALGSVLMSYLGKWTREVENFKDINFDDHGMLARKGVTENDWQVWKRADLEDWGMKNGVLTPDSVYKIPDEKLADLGDPAALKRSAATKLLGHVLEEVGMGVMDTGSRERTRLLYGGQAGTLAGELTRSAMLFKSFSASMMMKHWTRAASMPTGSSAAQYAATLLVTGTIMGALASQMRNVSSGKNPANMAEPSFWGEALLRGGGLGFYGDFLYSELSSNDTSLTASLLGGPLGSTADELWNLTGGYVHKESRGERTDEGAKATRFARGNIPFLNMWYTKTAFDHLIYNNMQEAANPGYLDRMQAKAYDQRGTTWWWNPQQNEPSQAPDIRQAWQPDRGREQLQKMADTLGINH
jgi:hypothetical protein